MTAPPSAARKRPFDSFRENVDAIAVAIVLALIIRHFSVEAFEIPTGSMAPTLFGIHVWVRCPDCDTEFNIGLRSNPNSGVIETKSALHTVYWGACPTCKLPHHRYQHDEDEPKAGLQVAPGDAFICPNDKVQWMGKDSDFSKEEVYIEFGVITCPICWYRFKEVVPTGWFHRTGGHKILVDKFSYKFGKPRRWDVIVFQFDREVNYIKRLLGLPGEKVEFKGGDLYIDGKIERKFTSPQAQESLWVKVGDLDIPEKGFQKTPAWKEVFPSTGNPPAGSFTWLPDARRFSVNTGLAGSSRIATLRYGRPFVNYIPYNLLQPDFHETQLERPSSVWGQVGDKKVAFTARIGRGSSGWIGVEIDGGRDAFQVRIPIGKEDPARPAMILPVPPPDDPQHLRADRTPAAPPAGSSWPTAAVALAPESVKRIEVEDVDDRVALRIDGKEVLALEYDGGGLLPSAEANCLFLLAGDGAACDIESVRVFRDVYYTDSSAMMRYAVNGNPVVLGSGREGNEYFACGDNSPASQDSRYWGPVPERNLMGNGLLVFWPLWPANFQFKFIK